ncbi:hypothetical protein [Alteribacter populi]|uniref:hypothetical protein n=1 Tax=Alteribacter populi TaxID=2011011 RepID=UPI000BBB517A|nr:hypothetical protein [Alteribacter populi]
MNQKTQSSVVNHTLLNLYYKHQHEELKQGYPRVLALLSYHMIGVEEGFSSLRELNQQKARVQIWPDNLAKKYYSKNQILTQTGIDDWVFSDQEVELIKHHYQHLFIPVLPFSLLSAIIRYEDRQPFVRLILWALFAGVKVSALTLGADPSHSAWKERQLDQGAMYLQHDISRQLNQLRNMGIQGLELKDVGEWLYKSRTSKKKRVLTEKDITDAHLKKESELYIQKGCIVTPLALDVAKQYNIELIFPS